MRLILSAAVLAVCTFSTAALADDPAPVSPACGLLTEAEATQLLGHKPMVSDGGPEVMGSSSCSWVDTETYNALGVSVMGGESLGGATPDAAYEAQKSGLAMAGKVEDVADVGEKAFLLDSSSGGMTSLTLTILKNSRIASINVSGVEKAKLIEAGKLIAGHL